MDPSRRVKIAPAFGAMVISLDFELHWGVRDTRSATGPYLRNLLGAREAIPRLLELFEEFGVSATWATVGMLFAGSLDQLREFSPQQRPAYRSAQLCPYGEPVGADEREDPIHFAPSLIRRIADSPGQEVGTHTFSHYYALEAGQTAASFGDDLKSALAIAETRGIRLRSLVWPRNQVNPEYSALLRSLGITSFRGNLPYLADQPPLGAERRVLPRIQRLADAYVPITGPRVVRWEEVLEEDGLANLPGSFFFRPWTSTRRMLETLRLQRIKSSLRGAAISHGIVHLWWHPHNFGAHTERNLAQLREVLVCFRDLRETYDFRSLSMAAAADLALGSGR